MPKKRTPKPGWEGWADRLQDHYEKLGLSAGQAAQRLDMTEGGMRHKFNGTRKIHLDQLFIFCEKLNADPYAILGAPAAVGAEQVKAIVKAVQETQAPPQAAKPKHPAKA